MKILSHPIISNLFLAPAPTKLAATLQISPTEIAQFHFGREYHYRPFPLTKSDGRERRILAPSPKLKQLQRRLLDRYLEALPVHTAATAFRRHSSAVANARLHSRGRLIATVDLRDFFESTTASRVRSWFARQGWRGDELRALMGLCVYRDGLPQGAPTSPALSNLVNFSLDERLQRLADRSNAVYTRYCDDLTFSWDADAMPAGFARAVEDALHAAGYEVQPAKGWRIQPIRQRPVVTGVVLRGNGKLALPWAVRWRTWAALARFIWTDSAADWERWKGYRAYAASVK